MCSLKMIKSVQNPASFSLWTALKVKFSVLLQILITWNIFSLNRKSAFYAISSTQIVEDVFCSSEKPFPWFGKILKRAHIKTSREG